jgi:hypothetical protein
MNDHVTAAVLRVQGSLMSGRLPHWRAEQAEEALNSLLAHPHRTGEPFHLERNALSDARKKLERRATLLASRIDEVDVMAQTGRSESEAGEPYEIFRAEVIDTVRRTSTDADLTVLALALEGGGASEVADALSLPYEVAKVRLSRARQRARIAWGSA